MSLKIYQCHGDPQSLPHHSQTMLQLDEETLRRRQEKREHMRDNYPFIARIKPMAKNIRPVTDCKRPYVDSHMLDKVNARVTGLDFDTGRPTTGEQFLEPLSPQAVANLLDQTKPFHLDEPDHFFSEPQPPEGWDDSDLTDDAQNEARFFFQFIDYSLTMNEDEDGFGGTTIIPHLSRWAMFQSDIHRLTRIHPTRNDVEWRVQGVFRCFTGPLDPDPLRPRTLDTSKPHLSCFLSNLNPPRDGELTTGELNAVILLGLGQAARKEYQQHRIFPVTVVCGSNRTVRIVQGVVDLPKQAVELRVSRIVEFPRGKDANWDGFRTLLGWFLGTPIGTTTY